MNEPVENSQRADVTPPGREAQVKALEKQPNVENPYAVAWASYNAGADSITVTPDLNSGLWVENPHRDIIKKRGGAWVLLSKKTGKVLGTHKTKEEAEAQERAVQANKHDAAPAHRVGRYDHFDAAALAPPERMENGWLKVDGKISRVGIQSYTNPDGTERRELRLPEDVFDPEAMRSFEMVPVTNTHPHQLLDALTAKLHAVGAVGQELRRIGDFLAAPMLITDAAAILAVEAGRSELSCGYSCELEERAGVHEVYGPYDAIQRHIRGNHVALVDEARAGHEAELRLDAARFDAGDRVSAVLKTKENTENPQMAIALRIDGRTVEVSEASARSVQEHIDGLAQKLAAESEQKKKAQSVALRFKLRADDDMADDDDDDDDVVECDTCGGKGTVPKMSSDDDDDDDDDDKCEDCDGAGKIPVSAVGETGGQISDDDDDLMKDAEELAVEQETEKSAGKLHKDAAAKRARKRADAKKEAKARAQKRSAAIKRRIDRAVRTRVKLEVAARGVLGADADLTKLDDLGVKRAVIAKLAPSAKLDGKSAAAVEARYDAEMERLVASAADAPAPVDNVRAVAAAPRTLPARGGSRSRVDAARTEMLKRNQEVGFRRPAAK